MSINDEINKIDKEIEYEEVQYRQFDPHNAFQRTQSEAEGYIRQLVAAGWDQGDARTKAERQFDANSSYKYAESRQRDIYRKIENLKDKRMRLLLQL